MGDSIVIRVVDKFGLASLQVSIDKVDGTDIKTGRAMEIGNHTGK